MRQTSPALHAVPPPATIEHEELLRRSEDEDTSFVLLNVLPRPAFAAGRIPGSVNLPLAELAERAGEALPAKDQETVVYCASSTCSLAGQAAVLLRNLGYSLVREYPGGLEEWAERGGRLERDALSVRPAAPPPPKGKLSTLAARLSPAAAFAWASNQPLPALFGIWLGISVLFALLYWGGGRAAGTLVSGGAAVASDWGGLGTAFGYSIATAMSAGYGDVVAVGWARLAVLAETALGLVLFSALVSKVLGSQQEDLLAEVHVLAFENRLGRVRTNLHLVLAELGEISSDCSNPSVPARRLRVRIEAVAMILAGELGAVRDLVHGRPGGADDAALETLFGCLAAGLQELTDLLTCLPAGQQRSGPLRRSLRRIAELGGGMCGVCTVRPYPPAVRTLMDQVHRLARSLSDDLQPGDPAPAFALPGSDGRTHRLADHRGKNPLVLVWFPRAFTGG